MSRPTTTTTSAGERQIRYARILGLVCCLAGFTFIILGWSGMAKRASLDEMLPYVVSGGAGGISLILLGVGILLIAQIRSERQRLNGVLDLMGRGVERYRPGSMQSAVRDGQGAARPAAGEPFFLQVPYVRALAVIFLLGGFVAVILGWSGMAKQACLDCQLPYLLSGGVLGVALILAGVTLLIVAQMRTERAKLMTVMEIIARAIGRQAEEAHTVEATPSKRFSGVMVVAGPSTYHREGCRLIDGKPGLDRLAIEAAESSGLSPCRVCKPREGLPAEAEASLAAVDSRREVTPEVERELVPAQVETTAAPVAAEADPFAAHRDPMEAYMASAGESAESGATDEEQVAPPPGSAGEEAPEDPEADDSAPAPEEPATDDSPPAQEEGPDQGSEQAPPAPTESDAPASASDSTGRARRGRRGRRSRSRGDEGQQVEATTDGDYEPEVGGEG